MCKAPKEDEFRGAESTGSAKGMMAGANLFGLINAVLTCVVLGIVATRGGDVTKKTTNNAAGTTTTLSIPDFFKGYAVYGENPCLGAETGARVNYDGVGFGEGLGDLDCENSLVGAQAGTDVTKDKLNAATDVGTAGAVSSALDPVVDYNAAGMCTVNVHWHIGAEHRSDGEYDPDADFDHPNKDTYAGSHRRLADADKGVRIGHMCNVGKQLWDEADPSVKNSDGSVNEYDWKYCKDMHVGLTYEFHWPHSSLGACQTPWQYQYHFLDGVLCKATMGDLDWEAAKDAVVARAHNIGVEGQVFTIVNGITPEKNDALGQGNAVRPTWDVLNGWDRQAIEETKNAAGGGVAYYQGSTTGDAANNDDVCRGTGNLVTWHQDRKCHTLEASTMDEMCRRMLVISADDMSPDVVPHGARETVTNALSDTPEDHPDYTRRLRGSN